MVGEEWVLITFSAQVLKKKEKQAFKRNPIFQTASLGVKSSYVIQDLKFQIDVSFSFRCLFLRFVDVFCFYCFCMIIRSISCECFRIYRNSPYHIADRFFFLFQDYHFFFRNIQTLKLLVTYFPNSPESMDGHLMHSYI